MMFPRPTQMCWICGKTVIAEAFETDEHGSMVHKRCHAVRQLLANEVQKAGTLPPRPAPTRKQFDARRAG
jgi:hypothetical protein